MNIQAIFDQEALDMLKDVSAYIATLDKQRAGHHRHVALRAVSNSATALSDMTASQIKKLDSEILGRLKQLDCE